MKQYIKELIFPAISIFIFGVAAGLILISVLEGCMGGVG